MREMVVGGSGGPEAARLMKGESFALAVPLAEGEPKSGKFRQAAQAPCG